MHLTYKICAFGLQKFCIRPTKVLHPTYKSCASDLQICASNLQKLCIRPTTGLHPTQRSEQLTFSRSDALFLSIECVSDMHRTNSNLKLLKTQVRLDPKYLIRNVPFKWKIWYFLIIVRKCALNDIFADWVITKMRRI